MFRKTRALSLASLCGFLAAAVFFVIGLYRTIHFSNWQPYATIDWQTFLTQQRPNFGGDFFTHSFLGVVSMAALVFLLALATRTYRLHPTSTVAGAGFLGLGTALMAAYSVWLAFGHDTILLRYSSTQDEALRQTYQHLYQAGFLDAPVISALLAYFAIPGFVFLGLAFWGRKDGRLPLWPWCWASAASLLFAVLTLGYGYDRTFGASQFPRTLMIWGHVGLWLLPTITLALCAYWLLQPEAAAMKQQSAETEPPAIKAA
ncbi:MAG: hypothetical protein HY236_16950 [Acidobacteria bacterium]|nr:hypothetical protein [Acidobacteriota bacterium]